MSPALLQTPPPTAVAGPVYYSFTFHYRWRRGFNVNILCMHIIFVDYIYASGLHFSVFHLLCTYVHYFGLQMWMNAV